MNISIHSRLNNTSPFFSFHITQTGSILSIKNAKSAKKKRSGRWPMVNARKLFALPRLSATALRANQKTAVFARKKEKSESQSMWVSFLVADMRLYNPLYPSVGRLVGWSLTLFFIILFLWPHCSCPNGLVTSNMAPAHPQATSVAVFPALFKFKSHLLSDYIRSCVPWYVCMSVCT